MTRPTLSECIVNPSRYISNYFTFNELTRSNTASRLGIDNTSDITEDIFTNICTTAKLVLDPAREYFDIPFSPNSGYRSHDLERAICWGGRDKSSFGNWCVRKGKSISSQSWAEYFAKKSHPKGSAVDFEIPGLDNKTVYDWMANNLEFDQLILEFYKEGDPSSGWIHGSYSLVNNRNHWFTIGG